MTLDRVVSRRDAVHLVEGGEATFEMLGVVEELQLRYGGALYLLRGGNYELLKYERTNE